MHTIEPGTVIDGRYQILRLLGHGGMGNIYAAHDTQLGRHVALKLLRPDLAADASFRRRFLREAHIAAQVVHPNIVRTYDLGDAPEGPYLVQELLDGHALDALMPLPPEHAIQMALAVADALEHIHSRGYVHCDVKPQNIMLVEQTDGTERVVLLDFGIARAQGTDTTTLIATPHYLAPERITGLPPTPASDLYALGIVLYQTLTGNVPFDGPTQHAVMHQHLHAQVPPVQIASAHAAALDAIIRKLTAKQPEARYTSAAALQADLLAVEFDVLHAQPTAVVEQPTSISPRPAQRLPADTRADRQLRIPRWLLGLSLLLVLGFALVLAWGRDAENRLATQNSDNPAVTPTPNMVSVPNVVGLPVAEAQRQLEQAGLRSTEDEATISDQPVGTVLSTDPSPQQLVPPDSQVVLHISAGLTPAEEPVPAAAPPEQVAAPSDDRQDDSGGPDEKARQDDKDKSDDKGKADNKDKPDDKKDGSDHENGRDDGEDGNDDD